MIKLAEKTLLVIIFSSLLITDILAQNDQVFIGTRPLGMGEAFLAVADDGNAIYWNPAGLSQLERIQASFSYADLYGIGIKSYYLSFLSRLYFIPVLTDYLTLGMDWSTINLANDNELDFRRNEFHFALGIKPPSDVRYLKNFCIGLNASYLSMTAQAYGVSETAVDARGFGWNLGVLYHVDKLKILPGKLNLGFMIHDIGGTQIKHLNTEKKELILNQNIRWGMSYQPFKEFPGGKFPISDPVFAIDIDDRFHFGLELWIARSFALRAGIQKDLHTNEKLTFSFGLGIKTNLKDLPGANLDYALTDSPVLPNSNKQFGGSLIFKENPRLIRIEGAHINDVFASLYHHYGLFGSSIGTVKLKNVANDTLKVWVACKRNQYMKSQQPDTMFVLPGTTLDFPLRTVFKSEIFNSPEDRLTSEIKVFYEYERSIHSTTATIEFSLFAKNYLTWDDPAKAAAFVTIDHPVIENFVDQALDVTIENDIARWFRNNRMADAVKLYYTLKAYGIKYRPDPEMPFLSLADTSHGAFLRLDKIQYPSQLLMKQNRFGDCDDSSVLMASLLQTAGLPTAFVSVPGHIFIMFNTGIIESKLASLPVPSNLFHKLNGTLWIPIETTMIQKSSFVEAWETAADLLNQPEDQKDYEIFIIAKCQSKYPAVSHTLLDSSEKKIPVIPFQASNLVYEFKALDELKDNYINNMEKLLSRAISDSEKLVTRNQFGILLGENGDNQKAKGQFQLALGIDSTFSPAWNNLGNIEFISGNFQQAEQLYLKSLEFEPFNSGIYLNLAMLYQMMIDSNSTRKDSTFYQQKSDEAILKAAQLLGGKMENAYFMLGFGENALHGKADNFLDKIRKRIEKVRKYVDQNFNKYRRKRKIQGIVFDRHGSKGRGELDEQRDALLYWNYQAKANSYAAN